VGLGAYDLSQFVCYAIHMLMTHSLWFSQIMLHACQILGKVLSSYAKKLFRVARAWYATAVSELNMNVSHVASSFSAGEQFCLL